MGFNLEDKFEDLKKEIKTAFPSKRDNDENFIEYNLTRIKNMLYNEQYLLCYYRFQHLSKYLGEFVSKYNPNIKDIEMVMHSKSKFEEALKEAAKKDPDFREI